MPQIKHIPRKRFGQNFLVDAQIIERIIAVIAVNKTDDILEIGAGQGAITLPLLKKLKQLHAIEIDRDLATALQALKKTNLNLYQADILKFDLRILPNSLRVVGNLPYNISSPILFYFLKHINQVKDMTFMLQKEVVERIVAKHNNKTYGRLSVMMQAFFATELLFTVPPECFHPSPKIDSAIIYLKPLEKPLVKNMTLLETVVKLAFSKRRKTLKNCLKSYLTQTQTSIDLSLRAENLSVAEFAQLTLDYEKQH